MSNRLDHFEEAVRQSLDGVKYDYEPQQWAEMESMLNRAGESGRRNTSLVAAAGFLLLSAGIFALWPSSSSEAFLAAQAQPIPASEFGYTTESMVAHSLATDSSTDASTSGIDQASNANYAASETTSSTTSSTQTDSSAALAQNQLGDDQNLESAIESSSTADSELNAGTDASNTVSEDEAPAILLSVQAACEGEPVDFAVNMDLEGMQYLWIFGDGDFSSDPSPTHVYEKAGVWEAALSIQDSNGKIIASSLGAEVMVHQKPDARFDWDFVNQPGEVTRVKYNNTSVHASESVWTFDNGETSTEINPEREYFQGGAKRVSLRSTNEFGCVDEHSEVLYVQKDYDLDAPLAINPTEGEMFMPEALSKESRAFSLTVYHNMQPIFTSNDFQEGWDGTINGQLAEAGTEVTWVLIIYGRDQLEKEYYSGELVVSAP